MDTIFDMLDFLKNLKNAFCLPIKDREKLIQVKVVLTNLFQDFNSKKLESTLENVTQIDILFGAGDSYEVSDVVKILSKDIKELYKEYKMKNIQNEIR